MVTYFVVCVGVFLRNREPEQGRAGCRVQVIIHSRGILNTTRQSATTTPSEVTMKQGHRGHDLSSAPDKQPVWTNLRLVWPQTLVTGQPEMQAGWSLHFKLEVSQRHMSPNTYLSLLSPHQGFLRMIVSTNCLNQMFLNRPSYSAALFTVRSTSVCHDAGWPCSMVICMFP